MRRTKKEEAVVFLAHYGHLMDHCITITPSQAESWGGAQGPNDICGTEMLNADPELSREGQDEEEDSEEGHTPIPRKC